MGFFLSCSYPLFGSRLLGNKEIVRQSHKPKAGECPSPGILVHFQA